jgi:hypothetical protein
VATGPLALLLLAPRLAGGLRGWRVLPAWLGVAAAVLGAAWFFNAAG